MQAICTTSGSMHPRDYPDWPRRYPRTLSIPATTLGHNLRVAAQRYPDKSALVFYDNHTTYVELVDQVAHLAAYLVSHCGVASGDRVLLNLQTSPQFVASYYAILQAGAVAVPINPMSVTDELSHCCQDSGARCIILSDDVLERAEPLMGTALEHAVVACYADALMTSTTLAAPTGLTHRRAITAQPDIHPWRNALGGARLEESDSARCDDLALILYTSGTTGKPKGCMHTHRTAQTTAVGAALWEGMTSESVILCTAPMFHVTGMQHSMNAGLYSGATMVMLPRWDPAVAGELIERHHCTHWANVPTMVVDLLAHPDTNGRDLSSLVNIFGGGASMPDAVAQELFERCGVRYMEAYGMTESLSQTHMNPPNDLRKQCLGIPTFDTHSMVVDPETLKPLGVEEPGEILSSGPQLMKGYWNNPQATRETLIDIDGRTWLRTGDLGRMDASGFFYIADRLKRMINAAGFKVWPAEVESTLYKHPAIKEVTVVSAPDERRGETVKAYVVLKPDTTLNADALMAWSRAHMAAYKIPRQVQFIDALPRSGSGKIQWRVLQEREWQGH